MLKNLLSIINVKQEEVLDLRLTLDEAKKKAHILVIE